MELLCPAGGLESLKIAVDNGADAVYLGIGKFHARQFSHSFEDIKEAVSYAHARNVYVYFTLNTLVCDKELPLFIKTAKQAISAGADAIIVQDIGALSLLKRLCPKIPLHASTQMTLSTTCAVNAVCDLGVSRVVLARELTKQQIKQIAKNTKAELEVFVHGALCVCYSGQCLFSSFLGGRSANRGVCAQPCRLPYKLNNKDGYLLSTKDLCLVDEIKELEEAGVHSLKIEGRMKSPEYVGTVTKIYKKAKDNIALTKEDKEALLLAFNRGGFTKGLFSNAKDRLYSRQPDNLGVIIGKVLSVGKNAIQIKTKHLLQTGDEIAPNIADSKKQKILNSKKINGGFLVEIGNSKAFTQHFDVRLLSKKNATETNTIKKTPLSATVYIYPDKPICIHLQHENVQIAKLFGDTPQIAQNRAITAQEVNKQLNKTGESPFCFETIDCKLHDNCALPVSSLNKIRREALVAAQDYFSSKFKKHECTDVLPTVYEKALCPQKPKLAIYAKTVSQLKAAEKYADIIYVPINLSYACADSAKEIVGVYPRILSDEEIAALAPYEKNFTAIMAGTFIESEIFKIADSGFNITNSETIHTLSKTGLTRLTVSQELNTAQINGIATPKGCEKEVIVYGKTTLMTMQHCPINCNKKSCVIENENTEIIDRKNTKFSIVRAGADCRVALLNSVPIYMADKLKSLQADVLRLVFTTESTSECSEIAKAYKKAIDREDFNNPIKDYTRGHFNKGITKEASQK